MHLISRRKLTDFWKKYTDAEGPLKAWAKEVEHAEWKTPGDVTARYGSADPIGDHRVVFNIKGNTYRLIVQFHYNTQVAYIRFIGTHAEYDKIDAEKI